MLSVLSLVGLLLVCYWTLRLAWADHLSRGLSVATVAKAIRLAPGDAALLQKYAGLAEPSAATQSLQEALALNPGDFAAWIQMGLSAEAQQDFERAEYSYRRAASVNRQYEPGWTLANYFFRRGNAPEFWTWAKRAMQMVYGDPSPLFRLCWRASNDPAVVLRAIPDRRDVLRQYLEFLVAEGRLEAAEPVTPRLLSQARPDDLPALISYCNRLLENGMPARAIEIWNRLSARQLIPYGPLEPKHGVSLTNGDFDVMPSSLGFDWRVLPWTGVSVARLPQPPSLRIDFSGDQPESCEILTQWLPVTPERNYRLRFEYRTAEIQPETGLYWKVFDAASGADLTPITPQLSHDDWTQQEERFSTRAGSRLARLVLIYRRAAGSVRIEGSLWLRKISLD